MKKVLLIILTSLMLVSLVGCSASTIQPEEKATKSDVEIARETVINKYKYESDEFGTGKFIEDIYKQYPTDSTIANIYYYCIAKDQYDHYKELNETDFLETAKEYALKIDPSYTGEFSDEMHTFVDELFPNEDVKEDQKSASEKENNYNDLTNKDKKEICQYIESRYDYYDSISGGYSGDKYSDKIMQEAADKYGLTTTQVEIIWMNMYSY